MRGFLLTISADIAAFWAARLKHCLRVRELLSIVGLDRELATRYLRQLSGLQCSESKIFVTPIVDARITGLYRAAWNVVDGRNRD